MVAPKIRNRTLDAVALAGLTLGGEPCGPMSDELVSGALYEPRDYGVFGLKHGLGASSTAPALTHARSCPERAPLVPQRVDRRLGPDLINQVVSDYADGCRPPGWQCVTASARGHFSG